MVSYVACTDCENDKIQLTSYSNFVNVWYVMWTVENSMKWQKRGLDNEEIVTDVKEREIIMKKGKQGSVVSLCRHLHISVNGWGNGTSYRLGRRRVNDRNRHAEQREGPREGVYPSILLYSVVAIIIIYAITHMYTNYTQCINTCNHS